MKNIKLLIILVLSFSIFALPAFAAEPAHPAGAAVKQAIDDVIARLDNPQFKTAGPVQDRLLNEIEEIIYSHIDFEEFSARTVGAKWREFSAKQKEDFQSAMSDLLYYTYFRSLVQYSGEPFEYVGEMVSQKGDRVEVKTNFIYEGKPVPVNFRMLEKNGKWLAYDLYVENVSYVQNYRGQFQQVLQKNSVDQLIQMIRDKAEETRLNANTAIRS